MNERGNKEKKEQGDEGNGEWGRGLKKPGKGNEGKWGRREEEWGMKGEQG